MELSNVYLRVMDSVNGKSAVLVDEKGVMISGQIEVEITESIESTSAKVTFDYLKWWDEK